jgi:serine protease Do
MLRPPAWFIYPTLLLVMLLAALGRRTHADSPPPPPALPSPERAVLAETTPIDPAAVVRVRARHGPDAGTAFSVGDGGVWLTAQASLADCARPALLVNDLEGVAAHAVAGPGGRVTVLVSARGAPALPLASAASSPGALAFAPGFPHGRPGEVAAHLIGTRGLRFGGRTAPRVTTLVWAEMGRTEGLNGALSGLAGAPLLDGEGRVVGLVLAEAPRRGRLYAAPPAELAAALAAAKTPRPIQASGATITTDDYGLAADALRRTMRVAPTACITR